MRMIRAAGYEDMCRKGADLIAAQILLRETSVLGVATGSTPEGIYRELARRFEVGCLDFSRVRTINLDEYRGLGADHPQSYRYYMKKHLFDRVNLRPEHTRIPDGTAADPQRECADYDAAVEQLGGIDFQLLGIGVNGHIGFNEPGESFPTGTHLVDLTESTIQANARFFESPGQVPRQAITLGNRAILQARRVLVAASGSAKARALYDAFYGPVTPALPASILQLHPDVIVLADGEALELFPDSDPANA